MIQIRCVVFLLLSVTFAQAVPTNDNFAADIVLSGSSISTTGSNIDATAQTGEPNHGGEDTRAFASTWWSWIAPSNAQVSVSTLGSDFDTTLSVYTGNAVDALTIVMRNDQWELYNTSRVDFNAQAGVRYVIAVDGYVGLSGSIALHLVVEGPPMSVPANDDFNDAITLVGAQIVTNISNVGASAETGEPNHDFRPFDFMAPFGSLWWTWTAPFDAMVSVLTTNSALSSSLCVYTGDTVDTLTQQGRVVSVTDPNYTGAFIAQAAQTYRIAVDGLYGASGEMTLKLDAAPLMIKTMTHVGSNIGLNLDSALGFRYILMHSTNLVDWTAVSTNTATSSSVSLPMPLPAAGRVGFYRVNFLE